MPYLQKGDGHTPADPETQQQRFEAPLIPIDIPRKEQADSGKQQQQKQDVEGGENHKIVTPAGDGKQNAAIVTELRCRATLAKFCRILTYRTKMICWPLGKVRRAGQIQLNPVF